KSVVQHEVAHQLLYNFNLHSRKVRNPSWFVEGLATLFEPPPTEGAGAGFNIINQDRLGTLRDIEKKGGKFDLVELIKVPRLIEGDAGKNYAQAWSLVYYLSKHKKKEMQQFVDLVKARKPFEEVTPEQELEDYEKCFGKIDESFKKKWGEFLRK